MLLITSDDESSKHQLDEHKKININKACHISKKQHVFWEKNEKCMITEQKNRIKRRYFRKYISGIIIIRQTNNSNNNKNNHIKDKEDTNQCTT